MAVLDIQLIFKDITVNKSYLLHHDQLNHDFSIPPQNLIPPLTIYKMKSINDEFGLCLNH